MRTPTFHTLTIQRVSPEAAGAVMLTLAIPPELRGTFAFRPGQFLTLRATIDGQSQRRSYSICSARGRLDTAHELSVGIKPVPGGVFSNWATGLRAGDTLEAMPPDGRFTPQVPGARHRVGFAAGSGITPILSIMASTLEAEPDSRFTLVYGNQRTHTILFGEALQDLKDRYPGRVSLLHILSRQEQDTDLLRGRIDAAKVAELTRELLPVAGMDEVFICGPEAMIESTEAALRATGLPAERLHTERFATGATKSIANNTRQDWTNGPKDSQKGEIALTVVLDGKSHTLHMGADEKVLDVALAAGLDLPWSCKGGVCCTCRARVMDGAVQMERNFTLEKWEMDKGFVLSCQARPTTPQLTVSYDER